MSKEKESKSCRICHKRITKFSTKKPLNSNICGVICQRAFKFQEDPDSKLTCAIAMIKIWNFLLEHQIVTSRDLPNIGVSQNSFDIFTRLFASCLRVEQIKRKEPLSGIVENYLKKNKLTPSSLGLYLIYFYIQKEDLDSVASKIHLEYGNVLPKVIEYATLKLAEKLRELETNTIRNIPSPPALEQEPSPPALEQETKSRPIGEDYIHLRECKAVLKVEYSALGNLKDYIRLFGIDFNNISELDPTLRLAIYTLSDRRSFFSRDECPQRTLKNQAFSSRFCANYIENLKFQKDSLECLKALLGTTDSKLTFSIREDYPKNYNLLIHDTTQIEFVFSKDIAKEMVSIIAVVTRSPLTISELRAQQLLESSKLDSEGVLDLFLNFLDEILFEHSDNVLAEKLQESA